MTSNKIGFVVITICIALFSCSKDKKSSSPAPGSDPVAVAPQEQSEPVGEPNSNGGGDEGDGNSNTDILTKEQESDGNPAAKPSEALALTLTPSSVDLRGGAGNLALGSFGLTGFSLTEVDDHTENTFSWDPAQEPLKSVNKMLTVLNQTAYATFIDKGTYIAKINVVKAFKEAGGGTATAGVSGEGGGNSNPHIS